MKKVLIAVDDTKGSKAVLASLYNLVQRPEAVTLLHVQRLEGRSLMTDMLGESELAILRESLKGTEHQDALDRKAGNILSYYEKELKDSGFLEIKTLVRAGIPSEEILKAAREEGAELILLGYNGRKGLNRLIAGSVASAVEKQAEIPVLVARGALMCEEAYTWNDAYAAVSVFTIVFLGLLLLGMIAETTFLH